MSPRTPGTETLAMTAALDRSEPLTRLLTQLRHSRALYDDIAPLLPQPLQTDVRPGSLDGATWTLLASHGAAAAKLRQLLPTLMHRLQERGRQVSAIKVRVQPRPDTV